MLTINNLDKIRYKQLGKKNFYVDNIKGVFDLDSTMNLHTNHKYIFELTNRTYAITVTLEREPNGRDGNYDYKLISSNGRILYISLLDIRNIDKFLDKLRFVALG